MSHNTFDVIILGAGLVGLTLAVSLKQAGFSVLVVEQSSLPYKDETLAMSRMTAITPRVLSYWNKLNILKKPELHIKPTPFYSMRVDVQNNRKPLHFSASEELPYLGAIVNNQSIVNALFQQYQERKGMIWLNENPTEINMTEEKVTLCLSNKTADASLLIGADGHTSFARREAKIGFIQKQYHQVAFTATVEVEKSHRYGCYQVCYDNAILAHLPVGQKLCSIVWTLPENTPFIHASHEMLEKEMGLKQPLLGKMRIVGEGRWFPLFAQSAHQYVQERIVLIGDAAHVVHPLAGQGANLGLMDAITLYEKLILARERKRELNDPFILKQFEIERTRDNQTMHVFIDWFQEVYTGSKQHLRVLANWSSLFVEACPFLKNKMMRYATQYVLT